MTTGKLMALIIGAYLLYYAGLFIYVLFFEKEKTSDVTEEIDVFTFDDNVKTQNVTIEEAENLNVTEFTDFSMPEVNSSLDDEGREQDLNTLKQKFAQETFLENDQEEEKKDDESAFSVKQPLHSAEEVANNMINAIKNNKFLAEYKDCTNFAIVRTLSANEKLSYSS